MLAQLATHRRPSVPALTELGDACTHARTLDQHQRPEMFGAVPRSATRRRRTAPGDSAGADHDRATERSCIVDQAELRWRIRRDLTSLFVENVLAGNGITREAERHLVPWLKLACETLEKSDEHRRSPRMSPRNGASAAGPTCSPPQIGPT
ncbi:hypothetical protein ACFQ70_32935, partial [Rhodococcus koreensis]